MQTLSPSKQRGAVSLVELMIVLVISAILSLYSTTALRTEADDGVATRTAAYLVSATAALQRYSLENFNALQTGAGVNGFVAPSAPTMTELKAAEYLPANFNATTPTGQTVRFDVVNSDSTCTGVNCLKTAMTCITDAFKLRGNFRDDLASVAVAKITALNGRGGRSNIGRGSQVLFSGFPAQPNLVKDGVSPQGIEGVVCAQLESNSPLDLRYVQMNETRPVTLNNELSVNNGNLSMISGTDSAGKPCKRVAINPGKGEISTYRETTCDNDLEKYAVSIMQVDLPDGKAGGVVTKNQSDTTVSQIRGDGIFWVSKNNVSKAAITPDSTLIPDATPYAACTHNDHWARGQSAGVYTLFRCTSGKWIPFNGAVAGTACPSATPGATAVDSTTSVSLICTNGIWIKTADRIGKYAIQKNVDAVNGDLVNKPACDAVSTPVAVVMPTGLPPQEDVYVYLNLLDGDSYWEVSIKDQLGANSNTTVKLQLSCLYP
ncbi:MAG: prepilin-type N-terminal cleavage/methylation domain-containing protein [Rhodoferax sp.]|nr:prepilin-type N-terminal cleavage/methylation domain-containing protein [Rhodoferax sp.]